MAITASLVKELRERTGSGMMECKKALVETGGDIEAAIEHMRKSGLAKADKKADRVAAEGQVAIAITDDRQAAAMVEVNSETDFVSKGDDFSGFVQGLAERILADDPADLDAVAAMSVDGETAEDRRKALVAKLGENIQIRRFVRMATDGVIGAYRHGERIGVLVELSGGSEELARDLAMHIAATKPMCVDESEVDEDTLEKEREIFRAQAAESGKPPEIVDKMVSGRIRKFLGEVTLVGQPFVKDPDMTVGKLLEKEGAKVIRFERMEVGEGIDKEEADFAEEVMAQVKGG
jgi:elongation factor Ts